MIQFLGEKKKLEEFSWYYRVGTTVFTSIMKKIVFVATCNIYNQIVIILFAIFDQFHWNWIKLDKFGFIEELLCRASRVLQLIITKRDEKEKNVSMRNKKTCKYFLQPSYT